MRSAVRERRDAVVWDVARPTWTSRVAGVAMAGFRGRPPTSVGHRVIPHPAVSLVVEFGVGQPVVDDAAGRQHRGSLLAALGLPGAVWVRGRDIECVQVRLSPVVARALLGVSPAELSDGIVPLEEVWGREVSRLRERLSEVSSWPNRFAVMEAFLTRRGVARATVDPEVAWAWRRIATSGGVVRVGALAAEVGWSRKRLWSRFQSQIGTSPKQAATLIRFDRAAHRLVRGEPPARVAVEGGYADQSHLHRDTVRFAGVPPSAVATEPWLAVDDAAWPGLVTPAPAAGSSFRSTPRSASGRSA